MAHPSETNRGARLRRQVRLIEALLRGETLTRAKAARLLGVEVAAIDRHFKVLRELPGVRAASRGGLTFNRAALLQQTSFPAAIAACLSHSMAALFRGTTYEQGMREALDYVVSNTPRRSVFKDLRRKFVFVAKGGDASLEDSGDRLGDLIEAVLRSKRAKIAYMRFGGRADHLTVEPLSIVVYEHQLYVLARSLAEGVHPYRFSRISSVDVLPAGFQYPSAAEYDPDQLFVNSFGIFLGEGPTENVRVRLSERWRTYALSHRWHRTQKVEPARRGVVVTINVRVTPEVAAWVLSFGGDAEVLAPLGLRSDIARHARSLCSTYGDQSPLRRRASSAVTPSR